MQRISECLHTHAMRLFSHIVPSQGSVNLNTTYDCAVRCRKRSWCTQKQPQGVGQT